MHVQGCLRPVTCVLCTVLLERLVNAMLGFLEGVAGPEHMQLAAEACTLLDQEEITVRTLAQCTCMVALGICECAQAPQHLRGLSLSDLKLDAAARPELAGLIERAVGQEATLRTRSRCAAWARQQQTLRVCECAAAWQESSWRAKVAETGRAR